MKNKIANILMIVPVAIFTILSTVGILHGMYKLFIELPLVAIFITLGISFLLGLSLKEE